MIDAAISGRDFSLEDQRNCSRLNAWRRGCRAAFPGPELPWAPLVAQAGSPTALIWPWYRSRYLLCLRGASSACCEQMEYRLDARHGRLSEACAAPCLRCSDRAARPPRCSENTGMPGVPVDGCSRTRDGSERVNPVSMVGGCMRRSSRSIGASRRTWSHRLSPLPSRVAASGRSPDICGSVTRSTT